MMANEFSVFVFFEFRFGGHHSFVYSVYNFHRFRFWIGAHAVPLSVILGDW